MACVVRDNQGKWIKGLQLRVGRCDPIQAERRAIIQAKNMASREIWGRVIVESDCLAAVELLTGKKSCVNNCRSLTQLGKKLLLMLPECRVEHIGREANGVADALAKDALRDNASTHRWLIEAPMVTRQRLEEEVPGTERTVSHLKAAMLQGDEE